MIAGVPLVEGTTGWNNEIQDIERIVAQSCGAFVFGANFSIGVQLFYRVAEFGARLFAKFPEYEAFVEEQHPSRKKDAPSGTALKLKDIMSWHAPADLSVSVTREQSGGLTGWDLTVRPIRYCWSIGRGRAMGSHWARCWRPSGSPGSTAFLSSKT